MSTKKTKEDAKTPKEPNKRVGRPRKSEVSLKEQKRPVGRPKGDATIINEYKQRMLASPKSRKVLDAIFEAALDNEHKNQAAAWKLVMDRILPVAAFEKDVTSGNARNAIQINITGVGNAEVTSSNSQDNQEEDYIDVVPEDDS